MDNHETDLAGLDWPSKSGDLDRLPGIFPSRDHIISEGRDHACTRNKPAVPARP